jgi:hypothetical protein
VASRQELGPTQLSYTHRLTVVSRSRPGPLGIFAGLFTDPETGHRAYSTYSTVAIEHTQRTALCSTLSGRYACTVQCCTALYEESFRCKVSTSHRSAPPDSTPTFLFVPPENHRGRVSGSQPKVDPRGSTPCSGEPYSLRQRIMLVKCRAMLSAEEPESKSWEPS